MKIPIGHSIAILLSGLIVGFAAGVGVGVFAYPGWGHKPPATEQLTDAEKTDVVATGRFVNFNWENTFDHGTGNVTVYGETVFLEADFDVWVRYPHHVLLVSLANFRDHKTIRRANVVDLGPLRAPKGSQKYRIPPGVDVRDYLSIVIWNPGHKTISAFATLSFR